MPPAASTTDRKPLNVLMLHGYTQNGPLFNAKTKALEKSLLKHFPHSKFSYPTGPLRLLPSDIPGFDPGALQASKDDSDSEYYGWWRRSDTSDPPEYVGLDNGLSQLAQVLKDEGPFDGVMGFSQGAAMATMVASLLEPGREAAFANAREKTDLAIEFPASFKGLSHPPLQFCVAYGGFAAPGERYKAFYEDPHVQTRMLHVLGSLDSVVDETRSKTLIDAAGGEAQTTVLVHPGGHFVPNAKVYVEAVAGFIGQTLAGQNSPTNPDAEEKAEDMDVPF